MCDAPHESTRSILRNRNSILRNRNSAHSVAIDSRKKQVPLVVVTTLIDLSVQSKVKKSTKQGLSDIQTEKHKTPPTSPQRKQLRSSRTPPRSRFQSAIGQVAFLPTPEKAKQVRAAFQVTGQSYGSNINGIESTWLKKTSGFRQEARHLVQMGRKVSELDFYDASFTVASLQALSRNYQLGVELSHRIEQLDREVSRFSKSFEVNSSRFKLPNQEISQNIVHVEKTLDSLRPIKKQNDRRLEEVQLLIQEAISSLVTEFIEVTLPELVDGYGVGDEAGDGLLEDEPVISVQQLTSLADQGTLLDQVIPGGRFPKVPGGNSFRNTEVITSKTFWTKYQESLVDNQITAFQANGVAVEDLRKFLFDYLTWSWLNTEPVKLKLKAKPAFPKVTLF